MQRVVFTLAAAFVFVQPFSANAGFIDGQVASIQILVGDRQSLQGRGNINFLIDAPVLVEGTYTWTLTSPVTVFDDADETKPLATIDGLSLIFESDGEAAALGLGFSVRALDFPVTDFTITSGSLEGLVFGNPQVFAEAEVSLNDTNGDGALLNQDFVGVYQVRYNENQQVWGNLLNHDLLATPNDLASAIDRRPTTGRDQLLGNVNSILSEYNFTLTSQGTVSGFGRFDVVPEPTTISFLSVGGIALWRLRRRRSWTE